VCSAITAVVLVYQLPYVLLVLQAIVIFTHFCTLSWMYEGVMRSNIALLKLQAQGITNLYNIGDFKHAQDVAAAAG
jgi:hypothetical protein